MSNPVQMTPAELDRWREDRTMTKAEDITPEEWIVAESELLQDLTASTILGIPGVAELVVEEFNNDIIDIATAHREAE